MQIEGEGIEAQPGIVAVVGLGKIGLPLAVRYASRRWRVLGCDANPEVVETINSGRTHISEEPGLASEVPRLVRQGLLSATCNTTAAVEQANVVVVIVSVQIDARHQVRFEDLDAATLAIGRGLRPGTLVIYETTLPIGTTEGRVRTMLEATSQLKAG
ncbi:MAG TPA: NAD(P)-binding domain-containing protein, partial [Ktedonobacteraceae bacterium]|nr:NAD(P)-binding domain-containing protein [Ktedonobacteraceae bacterium]